MVATDYSGVGTDGVLAYLDGHAAGANAVDIVRAAHELYGNVLSPRWMVAGLSEGGHAAYFAGHDATTRAPELDFRGSVVVAGPTHMEGLFPLGGPLFPDIGITGLVGYALYVLAGIDDQRPEENIREVLSPQGIEWMEKARTLCAGDLGRHIRAERIQLSSLFSRSVWTPRMYDLFREMMQVPVDGLRPSTARGAERVGHNGSCRPYLGATGRHAFAGNAVRVSRTRRNQPRSNDGRFDGPDHGVRRSIDEVMSWWCGCPGWLFSAYAADRNRGHRWRTTRLPQSRTGCRPGVVGRLRSTARSDRAVSLDRTHTATRPHRRQPTADTR
ncbi:hypothetical protein PCS43_24575 [Rhodococcus sp. C-2]|nr:hypothetical protein [Rhodococcus sp. C-2]MDA3636139.1 hypothetical protein [Rhodococcus sp. C-2]